MASPKRSPAQHEQDLDTIARMVAESKTVREIAAELSLGKSTVHRDIQLLEKRWRVKASDAITTWKGRLLAFHRHVIAESYKEFHRSRGETRDVEEEFDDSGQLIRRAVTITVRPGDPRYLMQVTRSLAEQARIVGAYGPSELNHAGPGGGPIQIQAIEIAQPDLSALTDAELARLDQMMSRVRDRKASTP